MYLSQRKKEYTFNIRLKSNSKLVFQLLVNDGYNLTQNFDFTVLCKTGQVHKSHLSFHFNITQTNIEFLGFRDNYTLVNSQP